MHRRKSFGVLFALFVSSLFPGWVLGRMPVSKQRRPFISLSWSVREILEAQLVGQWQPWNVQGINGTGIWSAPGINLGQCLITVNDILLMGYWVNIDSLVLSPGQKLELINSQTGQVVFQFIVPFTGP